MSIERPLVPEEGDSTDSEKLVQGLKDKFHKGGISDPEYLKYAIQRGFYSAEDMEAVQNVMEEIFTMKSDLFRLLKDALLDDRSKYLVLESLRVAGEKYMKRFNNLEDILDKSVMQRLEHYKKEKDGK